MSAVVDFFKNFCAICVFSCNSMRTFIVTYISSSLCSMLCNIIYELTPFTLESFFCCGIALPWHTITKFQSAIPSMPNHSAVRIINLEVHQVHSRLSFG